MSILYPGRVYQTSTTTGTGTLTLSGSSSAALTWQSKFGSGPVKVLYAIQGASYFELGVGTFTAASTLTRDAVYSSSNSDALVVLPSATHDVFAWLPGEARYTVSFSATKTLAISEWSTIQQFTGSSAATFNLPAKANMPGGFHCTVQNDGTANLTIDPSGAETVENVTTVIVNPGEFGELSYDGTTWRFKTMHTTGAFFGGITTFGGAVAGGSAGHAKIGSASAAVNSGATLDFDTGMGVNGWSGLLIVTNTSIANASNRRAMVYFVAGRGAAATFVLLNGTDSGVGCTITPSCPSAGVIRIQNTDAGQSQVDLSYFFNYGF